MEQVQTQVTIFLTNPYFLTHSYAFLTSLDPGAGPWFKVVVSAGKTDKDTIFTHERGQKK